MARAPASAPMPADPAMADTAAPMDMAPQDMAPQDMAQEGMAAEDAGEDMPTVLCTVLMNPDGTFQLVQGDENEAIHGGEEMAEGEGDPNADMTQQGETFDSVGPLLKAILDMVQTAQDGGQTGSDQMRAGYAGDEAAPTGM